MKRKYTLLNLWNAILGFTAINFFAANETQAQSTITYSEPGNSSYYEYQGNSWVHQYDIAYTYNSKGSLTQRIHTAPGTNQNLTKSVYTLDSLENPTSILNYNWQNNSWSPVGGTTYLRTYNTAGKVTELIEQRGNVNYRKDTFVYDLTGNLTQWTNQFWRNNSWQNNGRETYSNVNGIRTESIHEGCPPNGMAWVLLSKQIYAGWHKLNEQFTSMIRQTPDGNGNWINQTKTTVNPGPNGGYEEIIEKFNNGTWTNADRFNRVHDSQKNLTEISAETYRNNTWRLVWLDKQIFTYNSQFDILERMVQSQDSTSGGLHNNYKFTYSNFQYFTRLLGTSENQKMPLALNIFPNPASDKIQIQLVESKPQALTVSIKDVTGKTWQTTTFRASEAKQLNIEALPKGIYLLQLQTETGSTVKRIVKQ